MFCSWRYFFLDDNPRRLEMFSYIRHKVDVREFFVPFKGDFQGSFYDSVTPPKVVFHNNKSCYGFEPFISDTIMQCLSNGSLSLWGKVGLVDPPHLIMPITVEPSKPRMCHDERFLNLWIKDLPLTLDYISDLPRPRYSSFAVGPSCVIRDGLLVFIRVSRDV